MSSFYEYEGIIPLLFMNNSEIRGINSKIRGTGQNILDYLFEPLI